MNVDARYRQTIVITIDLDPDERLTTLDPLWPSSIVRRLSVGQIRATIDPTYPDPRDPLSLTANDVRRIDHNDQLDAGPPVTSPPPLHWDDLPHPIRDAIANAYTDTTLARPETRLDLIDPTV
ncbi:MAG: hypothetical protein ABR616_07760 [Dermatophilaceae bacterium]